jgi:hypothetical protein
MNPAWLCVDAYSTGGINAEFVMGYLGSDGAANIRVRKEKT